MTRSLFDNLSLKLKIILHSKTERNTKRDFVLGKLHVVFILTFPMGKNPGKLSTVRALFKYVLMYKQLLDKPSLLALFGIIMLSLCSFLLYEDDERVITSQPLLSGDEKLGVVPWTRVER